MYQSWLLLGGWIDRLTIQLIVIRFFCVVEKYDDIRDVTLILQSKSLPIQDLGCPTNIIEISMWCFNQLLWCRSFILLTFTLHVLIDIVFVFPFFSFVKLLRYFFYESLEAHINAEILQVAVQSNDETSECKKWTLSRDSLRSVDNWYWFQLLSNTIETQVDWTQLLNCTVSFIDQRIDKAKAWSLMDTSSRIERWLILFQLIYCYYGHVSCWLATIYY